MYAYDSNTGRRNYSAADKLRWAQQDLKNYESKVINAVCEAARSGWSRAKWTVPNTLVALALTVYGIFLVTNNSRISDAGQGGIALIFCGGIYLLCSVGCCLDAIGAYRGRAVEELAYEKRELFGAQELVEELTLDAEREEACDAEEERRKKAQPTPEQLLALVVGSASRDVPTINSDADLWAQVGTEDGDEVWKELAARNSWNPDMLSKVKGAVGSVRATPAAAHDEDDMQLAGFAG